MPAARRPRHVDIAALCVFAVMFAFAGVPAGAAAAAPASLDNGGFETPYLPVSAAGLTGRVARGWTDNVYGSGAVAALSLATDRPHGGGSAQRIDVQATGSGGVQLLQALPSPTPGRGQLYRVGL